MLELVLMLISAALLREMVTQTEYNDKVEFDPGVGRYRLMIQNARRYSPVYVLRMI